MSLDTKTLQSWVAGTRRRARMRTPSLGERELAVLDVLWRQSPRTAQQVQGEMPDRTISLSTIQSTLERLHRKDVLARHKRARAYCYAPKVDRRELISSLLADIADDLAGGDLSPMVSGFMDFLGWEPAQMAVLLEADRAPGRAPDSADESSERSDAGPRED